MALRPKYNPLARKQIKPTGMVGLPVMPYGLTDREKLFCKEYLVDLNGTQAAIRAGYSPTSARKNASAMLKKPKIKEYLDVARAKMLERAEVDAGRVIDELAAVAFINPRDFVSWKDGVVTMQNSDDIPDSIMRAISVIEEVENRNGRKVTIKFHSKMEAITLLMKHMGMLKDSVELSGGDKPLQIDSSRVDDAREKIKALLTRKVEVTQQIEDKTVKTTTRAKMSGAIPLPKTQD